MSNELDRQIGEKLDGYASPVDAEALWRAVRPPRRRRPWGWLVLLLLLLGVGAAVWLTPESFSGGENHGTVDREYIDVAPPENHSSTEEERASTIADLHNDVATETIAERAIIDGAAVENPKNSISSHQQKVTKAEELSLPERTESFTAITRSSGGNSKADGASDVKKTETTTDTEDRLGTERASNELPAPDQPKQDAKEAYAFEPRKQQQANSEIATAANRSGQLSVRLPSLNFQVEHHSDALDMDGLPTIELPVEQAPRRRSRTDNFVQVNAAYLIPARTLEAGTLTDSTWVPDREDREEMLDAIGLDVSFGVRLNNGWQLRSGLGYTQINSLFSDNFTTATVDTVPGLQTVVFGPDGSVDSIFGPVAYYETISRVKQTYNSFRQWEIPLLVGYNLEVGRLGLLLEGGPRLRLRRSWEGEIRYGQEALQDLSTTDWYRAGIGVSLQAGIQLTYPLSDQLLFTFGGEARYELSDFSKDDAPFSERYRLLGGTIGLRYAF